MIEARKEQEPVLRQVCSLLANVDYVIALLGREAQTAASFHVSGTGSSIFAERSDAERTLRQLPMKTLDDLASGFPKLKAPLFLSWMYKVPNWNVWPEGMQFSVRPKLCSSKSPS